MTPEFILILRLVSAGLLVAFLAILFWYLRKDLLVSSRLLEQGQRARAKLRVLEEIDQVDSTPRYIALTPVTTIGRAISNTIVLEDDYASNKHVFISLQGTIWWLDDLDSRNGTLLNGVKVTTSTALSTGDVITVGRSEFLVEL